MLERRLGKAESIVAYPTEQLKTTSDENGQFSMTYEMTKIEQDGIIIIAILFNS